MVSVIILLSGRSWTSVQSEDLDDHLINDSSINGPVYVALDNLPMTSEDFQMFSYINARQVNEKLWTSKETPASLIAKLYRYRFRLITCAGSACGFSGKARYSADVAVSDYRWTWTLVRETTAERPELPPPYK